MACHRRGPPGSVLVPERSTERRRRRRTALGRNDWLQVLESAARELGWERPVIGSVESKKPSARPLRSVRPEAPFVTSKNAPFVAMPGALSSALVAIVVRPGAPLKRSRVLLAPFVAMP